LTARGRRTIKQLIWTIELTPIESRTVAVLAAKMQLHTRSFQRALGVARQLGIIIITTRPGELSRYQINWHRLAELANATPGVSNATPGNATPGVSMHASLHPSSLNLQTTSSCMHERNAAPGVSGCWGREELLTKSDLLDRGSINRLFEYAVSRGRFQRHDLDRLRFEALCLCCARKGIVPGALLTKCVFGGPRVEYIATDADEEKARERLRARDEAPAAAAIPLAQAFARRLNEDKPA
jgi:hypothetical protein